MNNFVKIFSFSLFIASHTLYASKIDYTVKLDKEERENLINGYSKQYGIPTTVYDDIIRFMYGDIWQCEGQTFRGNEIVGKNLEKFNLNRCKFININLNGTRLAQAILTNTTCSYDSGGLVEEIFQKYYPKLQRNDDKAKLLLIASELYYVPKRYKEGSTEFNIVLAYWNFVWLRFYQHAYDVNVAKPYNNFDYIINKESNTVSWRKNTIEFVIDLDKAPHTDFDQYLNDFNKYVKLYCFGALESYEPGFIQRNLPIQENYYVIYIGKIIFYLKKAYAIIEDQQLKQEVVDIAHGLSKSYNFEKRRLLNHYISYQYKLVKLKEAVGENAKKYIHYRGMKNDLIGN